MACGQIVFAIYRTLKIEQLFWKLRQNSLSSVQANDLICNDNVKSTTELDFVKF